MLGLLCCTAVHVEDIIFHMFQYIQKLRTEGPQEWVFDECKVSIFIVHRGFITRSEFCHAVTVLFFPSVSVGFKQGGFPV